jgi:hypothetical protein
MICLSKSVAVGLGYFADTKNWDYIMTDQKMTLPSNKSSVIAGSLHEYDTIAIKNTINRFDLFIFFCLKCNKYQSESKVAVRFRRIAVLRAMM